MDGTAAGAMRTVWYRFRCTLPARWTGYLALALLLGLVGGVAVGSAAAARRTEAAFPAYLASTNPSDLTVLTGLSEGPGQPGYDPALIKRIAALPGVRHVASYAGLNVALLGPNGSPSPSEAQVVGPLPGSVDGEFFGTDRATVVEGRMADPGRADEVVMDAKGPPAPVAVGDKATLGFYTNAQLGELQAGNTHVTPARRVSVTIVGKVVYSSEEAQDDIDTQRNGGALFTPALTRLLAGCCASFTQTAVQVEGGAARVPAVEAEIQRALPPGFPVEFYVTALTTAKAQRSIAPTSIALAVFAGIAGLVALVIAGQAISRLSRRGAADVAVLRSLGASRAVTVADGLPGVLGAALAGSLLAGAVAVCLSPVAPLGAVRAVYPYRGFAVDWTALGAGCGLLFVAATAVAVTCGWRRPRPRPAGPRPAGAGLGAALARAAHALRLPLPATEGIRLAVGRADSGAGAASLRPVIAGTAVAAVVAMATVTFGASLGALVSAPARYGWNWTFDLSSGQTVIDRAQAAKVLNADPAVASWTGIYYGTVRIDRLTVPVIGMSPGAPIAPPVLSGSTLTSRGQVVLGAATLAALGKHAGDVVTVTGDGGHRSGRLTIAGTATLPSLGVAGTLHTEMGTGAVLDFALIPGAQASHPNEILVRLRPGADAAAARARLQRQLVPANNGGVVSGVLRPAEITDYRSLGTAPALLAGALALGAAASLWLTLLSSVRHRRSELAVLKTLGLVRQELTRVVAWQAATVVAAGIIVGVPLGIALGRALWTLFATQIDVVPSPVVPAAEVALIAAGALVAAVLVALVPGRAAARTPAAALFRAE